MASSTPVARLSTRCLSRYPLARSSSLVGGVRHASTQSTEQQQNQTLLPSVAQLLHQHNIPSSQIPQIPASGPKGRLLKGDVLSYVGAIASEYPSTLSSQISQFQHLDLSNIKVAPPPPAPEPTPVEPEAQAKEDEIPLYYEPINIRVSLPVSFANIFKLKDRVENGIGVSVPLSTLINRASHLANIDLPLPQGMYGSKKRQLDDLYEQILGSGRSAPAPVTSTGSYFPELETEDLEDFMPVETTTTKEDIIDILSGKPSRRTVEVPAASTSAAAEGDEVPVLTLTVPEAEKARAEEFLRRVREYIEERPDSLLLI